MPINDYLRRAALLMATCMLALSGGCSDVTAKHRAEQDQKAAEMARQFAGDPALRKQIKDQISHDDAYYEAHGLYDDPNNRDDHGHDANTGQQGGQSSSGQSSSDIRLKRDIVEVGSLENGIRLYHFRYNWADQEYVGVMAQEVVKVVPGAVSRGTDGYLRVDYGQLGIRMETWDEWLREHPRQASAAN
jgi:Chaperone of endosialidase